MKVYIKIYIITLFSIVACSIFNLTETPIPEEIAQLQTANAFSTLYPVATKNACTDRGWKEIETYMKAYNVAVLSLVEGTSIEAAIDELNNINDKLNGVKIDACTETYRQKIFEGFSNWTLGNKMILIGGDPEEAQILINKGANMIGESIRDLKKLGIFLNFP